MQFTLSLLGLASLGLHVLPALSAAVPPADLARRADESVNHVYRSDVLGKRHVYALDDDEAAHEKRHVYALDDDETAHEKRHVYALDDDEVAHEKRHVYALDDDEVAHEKRHVYALDDDETAH